MKTVHQLLRTKGHTVWSVRPETLVYEALQLMAEKNVGALLVFDEDQLVGIFSERDYARKVVLQGKTSKGTPVKEVMTEKVDCVSPSQSIEECMAIMTEKRIRHLPVFEANQLTGVISIGDVVKEIISDQEFIIEQLQYYITGAR